MNDKIYPSMVIRSQAEAIELLKKENQELKSVLDEIREYIDRFNIEYLHEIYEHNLADTLEVIEEILDKVKE